MSILVRSIWKCLPKYQREFLLERLPAYERQAVNKLLSNNVRLSRELQRRNCIFIHVPKCAGESVSASLLNGEGPGHLPLLWYERMFPDFYKTAFKFAFVRDPLERAYSAYSYLHEGRQINRDNLAQQLVRLYPDFDAFVTGWLTPENASTQIHFTPQWRFLCNRIGLIDLDFIGRQESLDQDFAIVRARLGVDTALLERNRSNKGGPAARDLCSTEALCRIVQVYERDYQLLGYPLPY